MVPQPRPRRPLVAPFVPTLVLTLLTAGGLSAQGSPDLVRGLEQVQGLVAAHRYQEVLDLLAPHAGDDLDPESRYAVAAEIGRANYHLGRYEEARGWLEKAAAIHPERVETALYLEGASYLSGRKELALDIYRELLRSGATDLYLAVTLPGERAFLRDPEVRAILEEHARPLDVRLAEGRFGPVRLGDERRAVERALGATPGAAASGTLVARAGPNPIWALTFTDDGALAQVTVDADRLLRYTPFRLRLDHGLDWRATAGAATTLLGEPTRVTTEEDLELVTWQAHGSALTLGFGPPLPPVVPPMTSGSTSLRLVILHRGSEWSGPAPSPAANGTAAGEP